jgi:hypothetical protein
MTLAYLHHLNIAYRDIKVVAVFRQTLNGQ